MITATKTSRLRAFPFSAFSAASVSPWLNISVSGAKGVWWPSRSSKPCAGRSCRPGWVRFPRAPASFAEEGSDESEAAHTVDVGIFFVGMGTAAVVGIVLLVVSRSLIYCFGKPLLGFRLKPLAIGLLVQSAAMFVLLFVFSPEYDLRYGIATRAALILLSNGAGWMGMRYAAATYP